MPQPAFTFSGGLGVLKWGNQPLPNGQGTMAYINLNDGKQWFAQPFSWANSNHQITLAQQAYLGEASYIAEDFGSWPFKIPLYYYQGTDLGGSGAEIGTFKSQFLLGGEQMLTTDNLTGLLCKVADVKTDLVTQFTPLIYKVELGLIARAGWWSDLSPTTYMNAVALTSGSATNTNVTYAGSVFAKPVFTLTVPNTNPAPITSLSIANSMAAETLTVTFLGNLPALTAVTVTIDSGAQSAVSGTGVVYDVAGTFPRLYGPAGQVQQISATLTPASGTATGCTLTCVATNRWTL